MPIDWRWNLELSWLHRHVSRHVWFMQTCRIPRMSEPLFCSPEFDTVPDPLPTSQAESSGCSLDGRSCFRTPGPAPEISGTPMTGTKPRFCSEGNRGIYVDTTKIKITQVGIVITIITFHSPKLAGSAIVPFLQLELRSKLLRSGCHISGCLPQLAEWLWANFSPKEHQIRVV